MGTRGFICFVVDGQERIAYNHSDSYPEGLGRAMLDWAAAVTADLDGVRTQARELRVVDPNSQPTNEEVQRLTPWTNLTVGSRSTDDWYCLLRGTQGQPGEMLRAGVIEDAGDFPSDSVFAEWGYVVDFDAETFEVYMGFQRAAHDKGRFASRPVRESAYDTYYPVALAASWPLSELPSFEDFCKTFVAED